MKAFAATKREMERAHHAAAQSKARAKAKAELEKTKALPPDAPARAAAETKAVERRQTRAADAKRCRARKKMFGTVYRRPSRQAGHDRAQAKKKKAAPETATCDGPFPPEFLADLGYTD